MRSNILELNEQGIKDVVEQQFEVAKQIIAKGLVPIIEPEVNINAKDKAEIEKVLKAELKRFRQLKCWSISYVKINNSYWS